MAKIIKGTSYFIVPGHSMEEGAMEKGKSYFLVPYNEIYHQEFRVPEKKKEEKPRQDTMPKYNGVWFYLGSKGTYINFEGTRVLNSLEGLDGVYATILYYTNENQMFCLWEGIRILYENGCSDQFFGEEDLLTPEEKEKMLMNVMKKIRSLDSDIPLEEEEEDMFKKKK